MTTKQKSRRAVSAETDSSIAARLKPRSGRGAINDAGSRVAARSKHGARAASSFATATRDGARSKSNGRGRADTLRTDKRSAAAANKLRTRGERSNENRDLVAARSDKPSGKRRGAKHATDGTRADVCRDLIPLHRFRLAYIERRTASVNRSKADIRLQLGFSTGHAAGKRRAMVERANRIFDALESDGALRSPVDRAAAVALRGGHAIEMIYREGLNRQIRGADKLIAELAGQLPAVAWVKSVKGFGIGNFASIIAETGDLAGYANPAKVWRRLGLAPFRGKMGSTWRRSGGLTAKDWSTFGYVPRRRTVAHQLAASLIKADRGKYRKRYDRAKAAKIKDWGKAHAHNHGMLLMAKLAILDLWIAWNDAPPLATQAVKAMTAVPRRRKK